MAIWLKFLLILLMIFNLSSFVWFLLGSTAYFQRGMDIMGTTYLWGAGIPVLLITIVFIIFLFKGWIPTSRGDYIGICVWMVLSTLLSFVLIQSVSTHGWANEKISSDSLKITSDGKYEYRVDLINLFQKTVMLDFILKMSIRGRKYIYRLGFRLVRL